jgi:hypothetical protein
LLPDSISDISGLVGASAEIAPARTMPARRQPGGGRISAPMDEQRRHVLVLYVFRLQALAKVEQPEHV